VARDIGDPTPEVTEQVGEDGFGQGKELLVPRIVLDPTKANWPAWSFRDRGRRGAKTDLEGGGVGQILVK
jgi:hypothetical protein